MSHWSCNRLWHGDRCGSQLTVANDLGVVVCRWCWAPLRPGEGNGGEGVGVAPDSEKQRSAFIDHERIRWP